MTVFQKIVMTELRAFQFNLNSAEDLIAEGNLQIEALLKTFPDFDLYDVNCENKKVYSIVDEPKNEFDYDWTTATILSIMMKFWANNEWRDIGYGMSDTDWLVEDAESESGFKVMKDDVFQNTLLIENFTKISE